MTDSHMRVSKPVANINISGCMKAQVANRKDIISNNK